VYKSKPRGRGSDSMYNYIGTLDVFNEKNKGPRTRFKNQPTSPRDVLQVKEKTLISNGSL
jgi:hypothetical protein